MTTKGVLKVKKRFHFIVSFLVNKNQRNTQEKTKYVFVCESQTLELPNSVGQKKYGREKQKRIPGTFSLHGFLIRGLAVDRTRDL